ncbi:transport protein [Arthrobacter crystallopoietes BAB-32]|uniref:Transport protein n=1 Tax=Arthrobacter crystallopoietes BAB-32 TaxID=1246476 RepID=N1V1J2_9MICC|nr:MFS transporter [Arthrobacter crystallopoietes]EMY35205.1 transport protein [Arthrobacter crystallopoietes BAB-32]
MSDAATGYPSGALKFAGQAHHAARGQRTLIAIVQVMALAVWFSASAVVPSLQLEWQISPAAAVWITASTQVGFVLGALASALANLADRLRPDWLLAWAAGGAAASTAVFALWTNDLAIAVLLRFATGVFLAGVYPVGMKLMASWSSPAQRGRAFGLLIGALTLGSALPHLIGAFQLPWQAVLLVAACVTLGGGILCAAAVRPGPLFESRSVRLDPGFVLRLLRNRAQRLVNISYFGHMWELYALWTWLPSFMLASHSQTSQSGWSIGATVFFCIGVAGVAGCVIGGWAADRHGRAKTAGLSLALSGACCLASVAAFNAPWPVLAVFASLWGAAVIADSGVFSTLLTEVTEPEHVGTALTLQTSLGFLVTIVSIQIVPVISGLVGWQYAFLVLFAGPLAGVAALSRLRLLHVETRSRPIVGATRARLAK